MSRIFMNLGVASLVLLIFSACSVESGEENLTETTADLRLLEYRFRADFDADLNADSGWAASANEVPELFYDEPFRLRVQVSDSGSKPEGHVLGLQYRWQGESWLPVGVSDFPYPKYATPAVSVVSTLAYAQGDETSRLLGDPEMDWDDGGGMNAVATTPVWKSSGVAREWEWPLVIRRFSDGPTFAENDSAFELRLVDGSGKPLSGMGPAAINVTALPKHLGGTFIETPGRIGPYQSEEGHLYFFMEPTETDNRFMAMRSTDYGESWREVDGAGRPRADDLEGVASVIIGTTIHFLHQVTREVFYHAFEMGSEATVPGAWVVDSESIAVTDVPPTQYADLTARSSGSLVGLYAGERRLFMQIRSVEGSWGDPIEIDADLEPILSGPVLVTDADDVVTMAYTGQDGSGFVRHLYRDGTLSERKTLSLNLGRNDAENGAILPLIALPDSEGTVVLYREDNGLLYERRFSRDGQLGLPILVSNLTVTTDAVDSEQVGADIVRYGSTLHLIFIESESRSIYHAQSEQAGVWSQAQPLIEGINASWLRGSVHLDANGNSIYGFVYDAGSQGGSGLNRYFSLPL